MISEILLLVFAIAIAVAIFHLFKRLAFLVVNAITGLLTLFLVNYFDLMSYFGAADISITPATVIICTFGGIPGAIVLILLALAWHPI